jgi:hypothetical protein
MYRNTCQRTLLSFLILPAFMLISCFGAESSLLCFGSDGHVAIEFIEACNTQNSEFGHFESDRGDGCGSCKDVQFLKSPAHPTSIFQHANGLPVVTGFVPSIPAPDTASLRQIRLLPRNHQGKTLASLHSVVLLI